MRRVILSLAINSKRQDVSKNHVYSDASKDDSYLGHQYLMFYSSQVALQFPDELLSDAVKISAEIEKETKAKTFILGDTSYGR